MESSLLKKFEPETYAKLLSKLRLSRRQCADLSLDPKMGDYEYDANTPGFTYLDGNAHIQGPSPHLDHPDSEKKLYLTVCNEGWDRPATTEGLAELEEILFDQWLLPEGFFDEDLAEKLPTGEELEEAAGKQEDPDFFYWTVRIGVHKSWVADGFDISHDQGECHDRMRKILPHCDGSEFIAYVLEAPVQSRILAEQGYARPVTKIFGKDDTPAGDEFTLAGFLESIANGSTTAGGGSGYLAVMVDGHFTEAAHYALEWEGDDIREQLKRAVAWGFTHVIWFDE